MKPPALIVTCEHGGNRVPAEYRSLFDGMQRLLRSHRGYDRGALELARRLSTRLQAPLHASTVTRLLVDLNRSSHRNLFSPFTKGLAAEKKRSILRRYYEPHRSEVTKAIAAMAADGVTVMHLSVHTFTPVLRGIPRTADVGLLYDPARQREKRLCRSWRNHLVEAMPGLRVRLNYPYLGKADGFTTYLRKHVPADRYLGIELELNQRWTSKTPGARKRLSTAVAESLASEVRHA